MAKDAKVKDAKNKKHFFKDFKAELKKVIWPTPKQIVNNTIAVITIVLIAAVIVFALDSIFNLLNEKGINRIKENIKQNTAIEETVNVEGTEQSSEEENSSNQETTEAVGVEQENNSTENEE